MKLNQNRKQRELAKHLSSMVNFDSEDDYRTGCRNVSHCQQQQSYSGLPYSP